MLRKLQIVSVDPDQTDPLPPGAVISGSAVFAETENLHLVNLEIINYSWINLSLSSRNISPWRNITGRRQELGSLTGLTEVV